MSRLLFLTVLGIAACQAANSDGKSVEVEQRLVPDWASQVQIADYPLGPIEDAEGNLWLGSVGSGAFMWDGKELHEFHA